MFNVSEFSFKKSFEGTHWEHREHTGYIHLFPIDPNVADVFPLVPLCSQCTPCSLCSQCIFHYSLSIYVSSVFPIVFGVPCVVSIVPSVPYWIPCCYVFPLVPCFSYFSPSVSRLLCSDVFPLVPWWEGCGRTQSGTHLGTYSEQSHRCVDPTVKHRGVLSSRFLGMFPFNVSLSFPLFPGYTLGTPQKQ